MPSWRIKQLQPGCCKIKVSEKEKSRSQRSNFKVTFHFDSQKGTISTIYDLFVLNLGNMVKEKHQNFDKIKKIDQNSRFMNGRL